MTEWYTLVMFDNETLYSKRIQSHPATSCGGLRLFGNYILHLLTPGRIYISNLSSFKPELHVKRSNIHLEEDRSHNNVTVSLIPRTKTAPHGEDVSMARQNGDTDPIAALDNHFRVNNPLFNSALFSYRHGQGYRPLTRYAFESTITSACLKAGIEIPVHGHSIRIGATLEYLLRGISFEAVKVIRRWKSDAFL